MDIQVGVSRLLHHVTSVRALSGIRDAVHNVLSQVSTTSECNLTTHYFITNRNVMMKWIGRTLVMLCWVESCVYGRSCYSHCYLLGQRYYRLFTVFH